MNDEYKQGINRRRPRAQLSLVLRGKMTYVDVAVSIHSIYRICITLYCKAHCFILIVCNAYIRTMTYTQSSIATTVLWNLMWFLDNSKVRTEINCGWTHYDIRCYTGFYRLLSNLRSYPKVVPEIKSSNYLNLKARQY